MSENPISENPISENPSKDKICIIIGASHGGVNCAFNLRKEGWEGSILIFDADPLLPYHRPPLSKAYLTENEGLEKHLLKPAEAYEKANIQLYLGARVTEIDRRDKMVLLDNMKEYLYDKLVLATGARAIIPPIDGLKTATNVFAIRTGADANAICKAVESGSISNKKIVVIGGGYIGLETAASLRKTGAEVTVLEREERVLARVTASEMSAFFQELHDGNGVSILTGKNVVSVKDGGEHNEIVCADGSRYEADIIIIGVGIRVNAELAEQAGLSVDDGIQVDATCRTDDEAIYAVGDCTNHHNPHYGRSIRLESVQNAVDQAKVAAAAICGKNPVYDAVPWFWSDQYDVKLQIVGLSEGYDRVVVRKEMEKENCVSAWYFKKDALLAVDAVNNAKAYVYGTKFIKGGQKLDIEKLENPLTEFKPVNLLAG